MTDVIPVTGTAPGRCRAVRELARLADTVPGVRAVHDLQLPSGRGPLLDTVLSSTQGLPVHRPLRRWVGVNWATIATLTPLEFEI